MILLFFMFLLYYIECEWVDINTMNHDTYCMGTRSSHFTSTSSIHCHWYVFVFLLLFLIGLFLLFLQMVPFLQFRTCVFFVFASDNRTNEWGNHLLDATINVMLSLSYKISNLFSMTFVTKNAIILVD